MCTAHPEDPRDGYLYSRLAPGRNFFKFNFTMINFNYLIIYHGHFHTYFFTLNFFYLLTWDKPAVCSFEGGNVRNIWFSHIPFSKRYLYLYLLIKSFLPSYSHILECTLAIKQ